MTRWFAATAPGREERAGASGVARRRRLMSWGALAIPAIALLLLRIPSLFEPHWYGDEGVFAAVAYHVLHGQTLYVDALDNKPPLIFLTYAAVQLAFGTGMLPLHAAATVAALGTLIMLMVIAARLYGRTRGFAAGAVFAAIAGTPIIEANLALTEIFMILPVAVAMLAALAAMDRPLREQTKWLLAAGVLLGIAANYKQVAVFDAAALALVVWRAPGGSLRSVAPLAVGFALPHVLALVAFTATGAIGDYLFAVVGSLRAYSHGTGGSGGSGGFSIGERGISYLPALIAIAWAILVKDRSRIADMLPTVWLGFAFAGALSSPFAYPHYLIQVAPPFALVVAGIRLPARNIAAMAPAVVAMLAVVLGAHTFTHAIRGMKQTHPAWYYGGFVSRVRGNLTTYEYDMRYDGSTVAARDIIAAVRADGGGQSLYAWANLPWLYARGGFSSPSRYSTAWLGRWVPNARQEIADDVTAHPPDYLVISDRVPVFQRLQDLAERRYVPVARQGDWRLYRRADLRSVPPGPSRRLFVPPAAPRALVWRPE